MLQTSKDFITIILKNYICPLSKPTLAKIFKCSSPIQESAIRDEKQTQYIHFQFDQVNLIHEFLIRNDLSQTANLLKRQALIADKENVEQYIKTIKQSDHLMKQQKLHKIKTQLEKKYLKQISRNNFEGALRILNQKMPQYFAESDLEKFAQCFLPTLNKKQNSKKDECLLLKMLQSYFVKNSSENAKLPNIRTQFFTELYQVWFVKFSGKYLIAIDQSRKGIIFSKSFDYLYEKFNMHDNMISNVKWRNEQEFATSSESGQVKLWNYKLEKLHIFKDHKKLITSIEFFSINQQEFLVSGGHDKYIVFRNLSQPKQEISKIKLKQLIIKDIKFYRKKNQLIFLNEKKKQNSIIRFFNVDTMKWMGEIKANDIYFEMEISQADDIVHVITHDGQIVNYSLKTHEKLSVFLGTTVKNFVIRMQKGGYMNQFLATGSQSGQILIYSDGKIEPIKRLKTMQKTVVNSVTWIDDSTIVCACDNGKIQYWTYQRSKQPLTQSWSFENIEFRIFK